MIGRFAPRVRAGCSAHGRKNTAPNRLTAPMIPLRAENPRRTFAVVNLLLIVANIVVFLYQVSLPPKAADKLVLNLGVVPARAEQVLGRSGPTVRSSDGARHKGNLGATPTVSALVPLVGSLFTSMFLHGGVLHLLGNMLFLWVFGASVEDHLGHLQYLMFYLICGIGAGVTHIRGQLGLDTSFHWGERRNFRGDGSIHCSLPSLEDPYACADHHLLLYGPAAGCFDSGLLVSHSVLERLSILGRGRSRGCGVVGACRRFSSRGISGLGILKLKSNVKYLLDSFELRSTHG